MRTKITYTECPYCKRPFYRMMVWTRTTCPYCKMGFIASRKGTRTGKEQRNYEYVKVGTNNYEKIKKRGVDEWS